MTSTCAFSQAYNAQVFLHGTVDNDGSVATRANYRWTDSFVTRSQMQLASGPGQSVVQIDQDYTGKDFSASVKAINPSMLDGGLTGVFIGSYLQSITPGLALGMEAVWQRAAMNMGPEAVVSYAARYKGFDWIASAQLQPQGTLSTTYWRRLTDKVEVGAELNLQFAPGLGRSQLLGGDSGREGTATVGAKYDFRASTFRAQVDSSGKLAALLEKRVMPFVQITIAGEIDQLKVCNFKYCHTRIVANSSKHSNKLKLVWACPLRFPTKRSWSSKSR